MHTRVIPRTGEPLPVIGMGTWKTFDVRDGADLATLTRTMETFLDGGGRLIDSSPMYGRAETRVGDVLAHTPGKKPFLATKVWTQGRDAGIRQMEDSFRKLRTDVIDLMQVHNLVDWRTHLETMRGWKKEGRVRYLGITHYLLSALADLEQILTDEPDLDFVQVPYSIGVREAERRLLPAAASRGVAVLVMQPFQVGELFDRVDGRPLPAFATERGIASWAEYFLVWILGHPAVTAPIPASADPQHMADDVRAGTLPVPDDAMRAKMIEHLGLR
jgi:diketogulonate reductase-like aldo/keto reductase